MRWRRRATGVRRPALGITYNLAHAGGAWGVTPERARGFEHELSVSIDTVGRLRKRGIRVLPGGDYGFLYTPHGTYARDLWLFVEHLGFTPMEALMAATRHGGEIMGKPGELGVVKAGALADRSPRRRRPARGHCHPPERSRAPHDHEGGAIHEGFA